MGLFDLFKRGNKVKESAPNERIKTLSQKEKELLPNIYLDAQFFGRIHIFDILPQKVITWNKGSVFWKFETKLEKFSNISQGEEIGTLEFSFSRRKDNVTAVVEKKIVYTIISEIDGVIRFEGAIFEKKNGKLCMDEESFLTKKKNDIWSNQFVFSFASCASDLVEKEVSYSIDTDPITKDSTIIGFEGNHFGRYELNWRIEYQMEGGKNDAFLLLRIEPYKATLKQIKALVFLFDSGDILNIPIDKKLTSYTKSDWMDTKIKLFEEQVVLLSTKKIQMVRYVLSDEGISDLPVKGIYAEHFQAYASLFARALKECGWDTKKQIQADHDKSSKADLKDTSCYVYLMHDEANGFYKIGISNKPEYREHTLQSEKPTIVLIKAKQFPVRPIAEAFEAALHKTYEAKRIRGEWFELDNVDVENMIQTLS